MNVHFTYKNCKNPDVEKEIHHLIEKLRKRLQVFRPELVHLKGLIEQNSAREGITVSLNLRLPSGQMAVQKSASTPAAAIKAASDDLLQQLIKHKEVLRNSRKWQRRRVADFRPESQVPFEQTVAAVHVPTASSDDIRSYVNAHLGRLERFVERELYFREAADELLPDSVSKDEVIDEAVARALGDGAEKPEGLALEPWLYRVAMRVVQDLCESSSQSASSYHLEESARKPNVRATDEPELQFHQPDETLIGENVIADRRVSTPEDIAYSDEMLTLVQFALAGAKRKDREAFLLHTVEGFSMEEIAIITDRNIAAVRASIGTARDHVRHAAPLANRFPSRFLQALK